MNDHALIVHSQSLCLNCAYSDGNVGFLKGGTTGKTTLRVGLVKGIILCLNHKKGPSPVTHPNLPSDISIIEVIWKKKCGIIECKS